MLAVISLLAECRRGLCISLRQGGAFEMLDPICAYFLSMKNKFCYLSGSTLFHTT